VSVVDVRDTPPEISDEAWDLYLGAATRLLAENGDGRAAALLVDARLLQAIDSSSQLKFRGECAWDYGAEVSYMVILGAPKFLVDRYTRAVIEKIRGALNDVGSEKMNFYVDHLIVRSASEPVPPDWRFHLLQRLGSSPVNQATIGPPMEWIVEDRCRFRSRAELRVYRAFKRARDKLSNQESLGIAPNPALVINGHVWEPDLLITYRGRVGIVEVDGPSHQGRRGAEISKDRLLRHSGVAEVDHFLAEDTDSDKHLNMLVEQFLTRLGSSR
jgi:hypothetical protein